MNKILQQYIKFHNKGDTNFAKCYKKSSKGFSNNIMLHVYSYFYRC